MHDKEPYTKFPDDFSICLEPTTRRVDHNLFSISGRKKTAAEANGNNGKGSMSTDDVEEGRLIEFHLR